VRDRRTGTTERVSVGPGGQANVGSDRWYLAVSADGRFVAFGSGASNLVAGDTNRAHDVFVRDRRDTTAPSVMTPWFPFASPFPLDGDRPALSPVRWSASDESRICRDELEQSVDGGAFAPIAVASPTATSIHREHAFGRRYRYRLRTTDCAGNTSTWKTSWAFSPGVADDRADALR
jgi:hypothetical protein